MCDLRRIRAFAFLAIAFVATGRSAAPQSSGARPVDPLAGPRYAVVTAKAALDTAQARYDADSARRMRLPIVRTYAGLEVHADTAMIAPEALRALDSTFTVALGEARTLFGANADTMLAGIRVTLTPRYKTAVLEHAGGIAGLVTVQYDGVQGRGDAVVSARPVDAAALTEHFLMWFRRAAGRRLPVAFRTWVPPEIPVRANDAAVNRSAYTRLATFRASIARACLDGSHFGCRASLGLVPDTVGVWYDANARRAQVRLRTNRADAQRYPAVRQCLYAGSDADCRWVFETRGVFSPTAGDVRQDLIRRALRTGGPNAFTRLVTAPSADVATLLQTAAGVPFDTLADEWRAGVLAARSPSPAPSGREFAISISISMVAIGLASRRRP